MRFLSKLGLATALATATIFAGSVMPAHAAKEKEAKAPRLKISKGFGGVYGEANKALGKEDFAAAKAAIPGMLAAVENDDDKYVMGNFLIQLGSKAKDPALQSQGLDLSLQSTTTPDSEKSRYSFFAGDFAYRAGDYVKAIQYMNQAKQLGFVDPGTDAIIAEAYFKQNDYTAGLNALDSAIALKTASGEKAPENWYARGTAIAMQSKNAGLLSGWSRKLVENYPTADNWRSALVLYRDGVNLESGENLDLMRLMRKTGSLVSERDYGEYSDAADPRRLPGEVRSVIEEGMAKGTLKSSNQYLMDQLSAAKSRESADRASLPASERDAKGGANGKIALGTADAYMGYGDYAKAIELYDLALSKGGVDVSAVHLRRAIAKVETKDLAGAKTDFAAVGAGNRKAIADFWMLYLDQKNAPAPAAAVEAKPAS